MTTVTINGKTFTIDSNNVTIRGNKVYADGKIVNDFENIHEKMVNITINGNVTNLEVSVCRQLQVNGECQNVTTTTGDVKISGDVKGNVYTTSGDVSCGDIQGNCKTTSGDIKRNFKYYAHKILSI